MTTASRDDNNILFITLHFQYCRYILFTFSLHNSFYVFYRVYVTKHVIAVSRFEFVVFNKQYCKTDTKASWNKLATCIGYKRVEITQKVINFNNTV